MIDALLFQLTSFTVLLYGLRVWVAENVAFTNRPLAIGFSRLHVMNNCPTSLGLGPSRDRIDAGSTRTTRCKKELAGRTFESVDYILRLHRNT